MKSTADTVIENKATKRMILSIKRKVVVDGLIEIFSKKPKRKTEKVVSIALSLRTAP